MSSAANQAQDLWNSQDRDNEARTAFDQAVRAFAAGAQSNRRANLIEAIVHASRCVADDEAPIAADVSNVLTNLLDRFAVLYWGDLPDLVSYREARATLNELFF